MARLNSLEELENSRQAILSKRDPNKPCISICAGTGCIASGAGEVITAFKDEIAKQTLQAEVNTKETGCPGFCERGPVVVIYPEEICYLQVTPEDVPEIVSQTIKEKKIVERLVYVDPSTDEKAIRESDIPFYKNQERNLIASNITAVIGVDQSAIVNKSYQTANGRIATHAACGIGIARSATILISR